MDSSSRPASTARAGSFRSSAAAFRSRNGTYRSPSFSLSPVGSAPDAAMAVTEPYRT